MPDLPPNGCRCWFAGLFNKRNPDALNQSGQAFAPRAARPTEEVVGAVASKFKSLRAKSLARAAKARAAAAAEGGAGDGRETASPPRRTWSGEMTTEPTLEQEGSAVDLVTMYVDGKLTARMLPGAAAVRPTRVLVFAARALNATRVLPGDFFAKYFALGCSWAGHHR